MAVIPLCIRIPTALLLLHYSRYKSFTAVPARNYWFQGRSRNIPTELWEYVFENISDNVLCIMFLNGFSEMFYKATKMSLKWFDRPFAPAI